MAMAEIDEFGHLLLPDGNTSMYRVDVKEPNRRWEMDRLQLKFRGNISVEFWWANYNARFGKARQDGRPVGFIYLQRFAAFTQKARSKEFQKLRRVDEKGDFFS